MVILLLGARESVTALGFSPRGGQEPRDERAELVGGGEQPEVAVVVDVKGRVGEQRAHDPRVHQGDDRVVVPGEDQGRLPDERQHGEARPADPGEELKEVADTGPEPLLFVQDAPRLVRPPSHLAAVQQRGDGPGVRRVAVAPRSEHLAEHAEAARHHQHARPGGDQHQSPAATWVLEGQLLGQTAAPGDAEDVEPVVAELVEEPPEEARQQCEVVGHLGCGGTPDAGYVEPDHLDPRVDLVDERLEQVEAGPDAVAEHQRRPGCGARPHGHANVVAQDADPEEPGHLS